MNPAPGPNSRREPRSLTPAQALQLLKDGNERFVTGALLERDLRAQVRETAAGQSPYGVVLGCIDSRVPPELVFDLGIGDIFVPRIAGNFVNPDILGSMEFATAVVGSTVIVVLGHSSCGAVQGACDDVRLGHLTGLLRNLAPARDAVEGFEDRRNSRNPDFVQAVAVANVRLTVAAIPERSKILRKLVDDGELLIVGAMHDVGTGRVTWFD